MVGDEVVLKLEKAVGGFLTLDNNRGSIHIAQFEVLWRAAVDDAEDALRDLSAARLEHRAHNPTVTSSNLVGPTNAAATYFEGLPRTECRFCGEIVEVKSDGVRSENKYVAAHMNAEAVPCLEGSWSPVT